MTRLIAGSKSSARIGSPICTYLRSSGEPQVTVASLLIGRWHQPSAVPAWILRPLALAGLCPHGRLKVVIDCPGRRLGTSGYMEGWEPQKGGMLMRYDESREFAVACLTTLQCDC